VKELKDEKAALLNQLGSQDLQHVSIHSIIKLLLASRTTSLRPGSDIGVHNDRQQTS